MSETEMNQFVEEYINSTSTSMIKEVNKQKEQMKKVRIDYLTNTINSIITDMDKISIRGFNKSFYTVDLYDYGSIVIKILNSYGYKAEADDEDITQISVSLIDENNSLIKTSKRNNNDEMDNTPSLFSEMSPVKKPVPVCKR